MSTTKRSFTRQQVASTDSFTDPLRVGADGIANVVLHPQGGVYPDKGVGFTLHINLLDNHARSGWAPLRNIGDPYTKLYKGPDDTGLIEMHLHSGSAYGFNNLVPGSWVRVAIYRLDQMDHPTDVMVRTSYGETFPDTPVKVNEIVPVEIKTDPVEVHNAQQWVSKSGSA